MIKTLVIIAVALYFLLGLIVAVRFVFVVRKGERDAVVFEQYKDKEGELVLHLMKDKGLTLGKARARVRKRKSRAINTVYIQKIVGKKAFSIIGFLICLFLYPALISKLK